MAENANKSSTFSRLLEQSGRPLASLAVWVVTLIPLWVFLARVVGRIAKAASSL